MVLDAAELSVLRFVEIDGVAVFKEASQQIREIAARLADHGLIWSFDGRWMLAAAGIMTLRKTEHVAIAATVQVWLSE